MLLGKILYGAFFCLLLPVILVLWAYFTEDYIPVVMPSGPTLPLGIFLFAIGISLQLTAMRQLWTIGRGLPMNAFPPEHYVTVGVFRWLRHPIYVGFIITCFGASLAMNSASGFLLVSPCVILFIVALVLGYEQPAMHRRWPAASLHHPLLGAPADSEEPTSYLQRFCALFLVFGAWLLLYYLLILLGDSSSFLVWYLPGEAEWPVWQWTEAIYILTYPFVVITPLLLTTSRQLRQFVQLSFWLIGVGIFLSYVLPFHAPPRQFTATSFWGEVLLWERGLDGPVCALPSFHVMWALAAAVFWSQAFPRFKVLWWCIAIAMSISCCTVGNHLVIDVLAGAVVFAMIYRRAWLWEWSRQACERLANSWHAYQIGPLRIINHAWWSGLAAAVGIFVCGQFIQEAWLLVLLAFMTLLGACLWGQWVTGSPKLLRPFGYYGAILGALLGSMLLMYAGRYHFLSLCAAAALAAPWVQAIGRLRCLVQGCCHGRVTCAECGIVVSNPHSRVIAISELANQPIHITQLYSIISNIAIGLFLTRLQYASMAPAIIVGLYGILNGVSRFVEEAYRGEVQTPIVAGLRLYQWLSIASIVAGIVFTCLPGPMLLTMHWRLDASLLAASLTSGLLAAFAMSMDFPRHHFRFARLSG